MCVQLKEGQRSRWTLQGSLHHSEPWAKTSGYKGKATGRGPVQTRLHTLSSHLDSITHESLKLSFKKASSPLAQDTCVHPQMKDKHRVAHPHTIIQS